MENEPEVGFGEWVSVEPGDWSLSHTVRMRSSRRFHWANIHVGSC